jgi:hypothetical protein
MILITNLYDDTIYSLDESDQSSNAFLRFRFPDICQDMDLQSNLKSMDRQQAFNVSYELPKPVKHIDIPWETIMADAMERGR